jgi:hypothetical protein
MIRGKEGDLPILEGANAFFDSPAFARIAKLPLTTRRARRLPANCEVGERAAFDGNCNPYPHVSFDKLCQSAAELGLPVRRLLPVDEQRSGKRRQSIALARILLLLADGDSARSCRSDLEFNSRTRSGG